MTSFFFFFKQKTAYEMRISDWSSDVCSSDLEKGDWYDAQKIENTVDAMAEAAGLQGYAFADVRPEFIRDKDDLTMTITFKVAEAPRVYVERVDINGNTRSEEHTSELQSLMRITYDVFCLKTKKSIQTNIRTITKQK